MKGFALILLVASLIEALVEYGKKIKTSPTLIITLILGVGMSFIFNARLFAEFGAEINHYADVILTGILASRGSNWISDYIRSKKTNSSTEIKVESANTEINTTKDK